MTDERKADVFGLVVSFGMVVFNAAYLPLDIITGRGFSAFCDVLGVALGVVAVLLLTGQLETPAWLQKTKEPAP